MELAVDVMVKSTQEPRGDGKASPLVGAVLWNDGATDTASRSELRDGDHAEFTLLERKHRSDKLDKAVVFSTLEPCAPGARKHPKLSCAERIVLARIKEVWVGIEDPDPTVDRKGIKYLQDNGVKVHLFDRDLQERIREVNREFIAQAEERAAAARNGSARPTTLSEFESAQRGAALMDLDGKALEEYRKVLGAKSAGFHHRLAQQGLLVQKKRTFSPTGFGVILFGKEPRLLLPQAGLLGTIHYDDGREEPRDFDGPAVDAPDQAIAWLKDKLPNPIRRTAAKRQEVRETFYELLREGIVNALVHRDYGIKGAKCQLVASPGKVVVMSPGAPVEPITMSQLAAFDAPMLSQPESGGAPRLRQAEARRGTGPRAQVDAVARVGGRAPPALVLLQGAVCSSDPLPRCGVGDGGARRQGARQAERRRARGMGVARDARDGDDRRVRSGNGRSQPNREEPSEEVDGPRTPANGWRWTSNAVPGRCSLRTWNRATNPANVARSVRRAHLAQRIGP
jgi:ATP-dependent DNA helicase RecG